MPAHSRQSERQNIIDGTHTWQQCSVTTSEDILTTKYGFNLREISSLSIDNNTDTLHYDDVIMSVIASQITSLMIVYSIVYSDADQRNHQSSASLAFVWGIHRGPVNSPHKWPVTRKVFPFDDVIRGWYPLWLWLETGRYRVACLSHIRLSVHRITQVGTLWKRHTLVPSPTPPIHSVAWFEKGRGDKFKMG